VILVRDERRGGEAAGRPAACSNGIRKTIEEKP
jgi:hypothetical protein